MHRLVALWNITMVVKGTALVTPEHAKRKSNMYIHISLLYYELALEHRNRCIRVESSADHGVITITVASRTPTNGFEALNENKQWRYSTSSRYMWIC